VKILSKHSNKESRPGSDQTTKKKHRPSVIAARNELTLGAVCFWFVTIFIVAFGLRLIHLFQIESIPLSYRFSG
jgi:hypothetical protein